MHSNKKFEPGDPDDGTRILSNLKANYGQRGRSVELEWQDGRFLCTWKPPKADEGIGTQDKAERMFLALLGLHNEQSIKVSASSAAKNYAPSVFSKHDRAERTSTYNFTKAMTALLASGRIANARYGSPSHDDAPTCGCRKRSVDA